MQDATPGAPAPAAPAMAGPEAHFTQALQAGRLEIQRCTACGEHLFPPRHLCTACGCSDTAWVQPSGRATVYSTTVVRQRPEQGGDYNVVLLDLAEGPRLMSRVEGVVPAAVYIGMAVQLFIGHDAQHGAIVLCRPLDPAHG